MRDDTELVIAARSGEREAFGPLVERWFDRCWEVAWRILHDRDLAADVAQDTLLIAWQQLDRLERPASFGGWILRIARNRALDRLARERRAVPTADHDTLEPPVSGNDPTGPEAAFARAQEHDLVWAAAAALGERDASLLDLHLRHGLEPHELAEELGIAPNAAHQALFRLRKRLGTAIRAWLLWRDDAPACVVLRAELAAAGERTFGTATLRTIERHVRNCEACAQERERIAAPARLFSAVPLVAAPAVLRTRALRSLSDAGVPVGGETAAGSEDSPGDGDGTTDTPADDTTDSPADDTTDSPAEGTTDSPAEGTGDGAGTEPTGGATLPVTPIEAGPTVTGGAPNALGSAGPEAEQAGAPPPTSTMRRRLAGTAAAVLVLAALGGWLWWRAAAAPFVPAVVGDAVAVPSPSGTPRGSTSDPSSAATGGSAASVADPSPPTSTPDGSSRSSDGEAPEIAGLRALFIGPCPTARMGRFELVWASTNATTATLTGAGGTTGTVPVSGAVRRCAPDGTVFTLDVEGPGGTASRAVEVGVPEEPQAPDEVEQSDEPEPPQEPTQEEEEPDPPRQPEPPREPDDPEEPEDPGSTLVAP